jgi:glycosyltransferase involved in cell wall biosynthesis
MNKKILILGTRGIPGNHGGFETFAERLSVYLAKRDWKVTVYCQDSGKDLLQQKWQGIDLIHIPVPNKGAFWSIFFDFRATLHALDRDGIILVFGYNTAIFSLLYRLKQRTVLTNMDGMEWWRQKWNGIQKAWLFLNERCGVWFSNMIIADHPRIADYFIQSKVDATKIITIPYGTEAVPTANSKLLNKYNLTPQEYILVIARPEPENKILEIVTAFSSCVRGYKLVILGRYLPDKIPYHARVKAAASKEVEFIGGVYDKNIVNALRYYARLYVHGHTVGGTNPSLVEALAAGSPILAQDNHFNRWVAGEGAAYFLDMAECATQFDILLNNPVTLAEMKQASLQRYEEEFTEDRDLKMYEELLISWLDRVLLPSTQPKTSFFNKIGL